MICHVCGYPHVERPPWGSGRFVGDCSLTCVCCGCEYGTDDLSLDLYTEYQREWLGNGAIWFEASLKPIDWDIHAQLANIWKANVEHLPYYFDVFRYRNEHSLPFTETEWGDILLLSEHTRRGSYLGKKIVCFSRLTEMLRGESRICELERRELLEMYCEMNEYVYRAKRVSVGRHSILSEINRKFRAIVREELSRRKARDAGAL